MYKKVSAIEELTGVAEEMLAKLGDNRIICLHGDLGVGKTTLVKEICKLLETEDIPTSPTFSIINEYQTKKAGKVYHFDFYRLKEVQEVFDVGAEEYFYSNNLCLIEWPEISEDLLPPGAIKVTIELMPDGTRLIQSTL
jgi:tRNA threonylcarbamoyladenosine biosynthesis protein TsaE